MDARWHGTAARWLAADAGGREREAEAEFGRLVRALPRAAASDALEARIWRATRAVRTRAHARLLGRKTGVVAGVLVLALSALYLTATLLMPLVVRGLVHLVAWLVRSCVWMVLAFAEGLDVWSFLVRLGGAIAEAVSTPQATTALIVIQVVGGAAFYVLNRVLAREKELSS